jgi:hypothetical protein
MKNAILLAAAAASLTLSACSVREGRIAVPPAFGATTERLELRGMGGGRSGDFRLAGVPGSFSRSADRLGIFDPLLVRNSGGGSFTLAASPLGPQLSGRCRYREREINAGPISVTPGRLGYHCLFRSQGRPLAAELVLIDPKSALGTVHGQSRRVGYLAIEGREIGIRSIHRDARGGLPPPTPLGYIFDADGLEVGAIDVNGTNKTLHVPRDPQFREAVIAAGLALSIFWDPADIWPH